jgi:hypothetical protein
MAFGLEGGGHEGLKIGWKALVIAHVAASQGA